MKRIINRRWVLSTHSAAKFEKLPLPGWFGTHRIFTDGLSLKKHLYFSFRNHTTMLKLGPKKVPQSARLSVGEGVQVLFWFGGASLSELCGLLLCMAKCCMACRQNIALCIKSFFICLLWLHSDIIAFVCLLCFFALGKKLKKKKATFSSPQRPSIRPIGGCIDWPNWLELTSAPKIFW